MKITRTRTTAPAATPTPTPTTTATTTFSKSKEQGRNSLAKKINITCEASVGYYVLNSVQCHANRLLCTGHQTQPKNDPAGSINFGYAKCINMSTSYKKWWFVHRFNCSNFWLSWRNARMLGIQHCVVTRRSSGTSSPADLQNVWVI